MRIEKQPGESWLVYTLPGLTQQEIKDKDDAVFTDDGLFIMHNDPKKTLTFIPRHAVCSLRSWWPHFGPTAGSIRTKMEQNHQDTDALDDNEITDAEIVALNP